MDFNSSVEIKLLKEWRNNVSENLDSFFLIVVAFIIYLMQCGFAFLECGSVRSKNTTNILIKNVLDSFIAGVAYWIFGYALAFGDDVGGFVGSTYWALGDKPKKLAHWFYHYVFAATAATIVSGALAERCNFIAYLVYSFIISGFIYPIGSHWSKSATGWLAKGINFDGAKIKYLDSAGSGAVHGMGGILALTGAFIMGPRIGRFDDIDGKPKPIRGHSVPLAALGGFILYFGFLAYNGGAKGTLSNTGDGNEIALSIVNTIVSGSGAAMMALLLQRYLSGRNGQIPKWSLLTTINGGLAGMVAICAGCKSVEPWASFITGCIASVAYMLWSKFLLKVQIDDPIDAFAVHAGGGIWGVLAAPIFKSGDGIVYCCSKASFVLFAWNLVGVIVYITWSGCCGFVLFYILHKLDVLRVPTRLEHSGLDIPKHDEPAYPGDKLTYIEDLRAATKGRRGTMFHLGMLSRMGKLNKSFETDEDEKTSQNSAHCSPDSKRRISKVKFGAVDSPLEKQKAQEDLVGDKETISGNVFQEEVEIDSMDEFKKGNGDFLEEISVNELNHNVKVITVDERGMKDNSTEL